ncbi:MAG: late competence development ComFB family protein [Treponema sp.]|nr:late competence development ComFB family protein [Treponema sp.]
MEIHNISEDIVFGMVQTIFENIKKESNPDGLCLCEQCKLDTICYALNRIEPQYIVSNRGITRMEQDWSKRQQTEADITTLVYKGLRLVNHNQRPTALHDESAQASRESFEPAFDIPTIVGRLFDGVTFEPISEGKVELRCKGEIVEMRNRNWQNPFTLVGNTPGTFTFWPAPVPAEEVDLHRIFEYSVKIESPKYESASHFFKIPVTSAIQTLYFHSLDKTYKLPDLYLFQPGEDEQDW